MRLRIDGSYGSGGGQILRTSLSLSALLCTPFELSNIRAKRAKPGLHPQHLLCVRALAELTRAHTDAALGALRITFEPRSLSGGSWRFDTGTAGSTALIFQALAPALAFAQQLTTLELIGGTENTWAPTSQYLRHVFLPMIERMGFRGEFEVARFGWYPKGGGILKATIKPIRQLRALNAERRGSLRRLWGLSIVSNLPMSIAERQATRALSGLAEAGFEAKIDCLQAPSIGQGTELFLCAEYENSVAGFTSLGAKGKRAERVADEAVNDFIAFHKSECAIDPHLSDQLLLYCALAAGESAYTTSRITAHLVTNAWVIRQFTPNALIEIKGSEGEAGEVKVKGIGFVNKFI